MDVTDEQAWIALADRVKTRFGTLDILVNNAGFGKFASIADTTLAQWRSIIAVNLDSVFLGTKYMMPLLAASGRGAIVNMSSIRRSEEHTSELQSLMRITYAVFCMK